MISRSEEKLMRVEKTRDEMKRRKSVLSKVGEKDLFK